DKDRLSIEELTSRVKTHEVSRTRERMSKAASDKEAVDVVLATNMISVGLDETRLGLMVVTGQPKAAAEYIQATSRVGRDDNLPAPEAEALRQTVRARVRSLLDSWERVAKDRLNLQYGQEAGGPPLLHEPLDPDLPTLNRDEQQFRAHRSLRDVEPSVTLHLL